MLSYLSCYFWSSDAVGNSNPTDNVEITTAHVGEAKKNLCSAETTWVLVNRDAVSHFMCDSRSQVPASLRTPMLRKN